jgi:hypothetical protein
MENRYGRPFLIKLFRSYDNSFVGKLYICFFKISQWERLRVSELKTMGTILFVSHVFKRTVLHIYFGIYFYYKN